MTQIGQIEMAVSTFQDFQMEAISKCLLQLCCSKPHPHWPHNRAKIGYSLKVTVASLQNGKIKNPTRQLYILVNDVTANVPYIPEKCQQQMNVLVKLVTGNALPLEDSEGTRGNLQHNAERR